LDAIYSNRIYNSPSRPNANSDEMILLTDQPLLYRRAFWREESIERKTP
jgi:hypothetical protein